MRHSEEVTRKILLSLLESEDYLTLSELSRIMEISKRSVQNYLNKAESWLREHQLSEIQIVKKQGYGTQLDCDAAGRQKLSALLSSQYFTLTDGSMKRRTELLRSLIFSRDELTIQFLADSFYVSRFVILADLDWAENWLAQYHLRLFKIQGRGIGIAGEEVDRRAAIIGFFDLCEHREPAVEGKVNNPVRLAKERLEKMEEVYTEEDIKKICSIIEEAEKEFDFFMGSEYFTSLATHITISVFRLRHGHQIQKEFLPPNEEFPQQEMNTAAFIARRLEETFQVHLPDSERTYICIHLMGYNAFQAQMEEEQKAPENIELLALHLIEAVDAELGGRFSSDRVLFFGLLTHLQNSLYQQKENPGARTQLRLELPEACQEIFASVKKQAALYQQLSGIRPDQQELVSLTLHFALSQDRTTTKWRALLVSPAGVIIQQDQRRHLQDSVPQIKIVDTCSPYQFSVYPEASYDFIISMVPIKNASKPVADVSRMTKGQRVQFIEEFLFDKMDGKDCFP